MSREGDGVRGSQLRWRRRFFRDAGARRYAHRLFMRLNSRGYRDRRIAERVTWPT